MPRSLLREALFFDFIFGQIKPALFGRDDNTGLEQSLECPRFIIPSAEQPLWRPRRSQTEVRQEQGVVLSHSLMFLENADNLQGGPPVHERRQKKEHQQKDNGQNDCECIHA